MLGPSYQESADGVLLFSGGLDSTVLLYYLIDCGIWPHAVTFDYGQRHRKEIDCARDICDKLPVGHTVVDLTAISKLLGDSALLGCGPVPTGNYAERTARQTLVPNRNMIMLSVAAGYAEARKIRSLFYGAHSGDWEVYPDCRPGFIRHVTDAIESATAWNPVRLRTPFAHMSKQEIVKLGRSLDVPFELTWSCYQGGDEPCGTCSTCIERKEALK